MTSTPSRTPPAGRSLEQEVPARDRPPPQDVRRLPLRAVAPAHRLSFERRLRRTHAAGVLAPPARCRARCSARCSPTSARNAASTRPTCPVAGNPTRPRRRRAWRITPRRSATCSTRCACARWTCSVTRPVARRRGTRAGPPEQVRRLILAGVPSSDGSYQVGERLPLLKLPVMILRARDDSGNRRDAPNRCCAMLVGRTLAPHGNVLDASAEEVVRLARDFLDR